MGYYVHINAVNWMIPTKHLETAYERMCELNVTHHDEKRGGAHRDGKLEQRWFSWMDENYPETCKDARAVLDEVGFDTEIDDHGLTIIGYDNKTGQEDLFLESISDLVVSSYGDGMPFVIWEGEDGLQWKEIFGEKEVRKYDGIVSFPGEENLS
tara:strand:+ start:967 stop:1428 length:462 start_codon:yes stop_codon:yes gene_type:complete